MPFASGQVPPTGLEVWRYKNTDNPLSCLVYFHSIVLFMLTFYLDVRSNLKKKVRFRGSMNPVLITFYGIFLLYIDY